jgi:signal transduction histidine kinase
MRAMEKMKILMVEDNKDDLMLIEHVLKKNNLSFDQECVDTRAGFIEALRRFDPDIVLSDHGMPAFSSIEALKICLSERPYTPFILVTGTVSDEDAIARLQNGVDDYIFKSNLSRLPVAIANAMEKRRLEKLRREAEGVLRKRSAELLRVNKELDNFVYSVSHNLKGPLCSVTGLLDLAENLNKEPELNGLLGMMRSSIAKLDDTLKDIIVYSRNSRNKVTRDEMDWARVIESTFKNLEYLHPEERICTNIVLWTTVPFFSDVKRLEVVFENLLANAIGYRNKRIKLVVSIEIATSDHDAVITIKDNGIGIDKDILPKVYNMFYRGTEQSQGSGLGLYIVQEIIRKLKGKIAIASVVGEGTTVTLIIPNRRMPVRYQWVA